MVALIIIINIIVTIVVYLILSRVIFLNRYKALQLGERRLREITEKVLLEEQELTELNQEKDFRLTEIGNLSSSYDAFKAVTSSAKEEYFDTLESEYEKGISKLEQEKNNQVAKYAQEVDALKQEKERLEKAVCARIEAEKRDKLIKATKEDYMISCSLEDKRDIAELEDFKKRLSKPRILSMLIWQTYYQKPLKQLCNNILGTTAKTGIYKITNQNNNMCYIGQAVDVAARWCEHVKCGCGIDTPAGNKLYAAMKEEGIYNFTFELLEECPRAQLNDKEREYIALYQSKDYGYNTLSGTTTKRI